MDSRGIVDLLCRDGQSIRWVSPCPGGEFGASYVERDGRDCVLKWWPYDPTWEARLAEGARRVSHAVTVGFPAPIVVGLGRVDDWLWHLQARVDGTPIDEPFDQRIVDQLVTANAHASGCATGEGETWGELLHRSLREGLDTWCIHAVVDAHSTRSRQLLGRLMRTAAAIDPKAVPATDLLHGDYHHRNVLFANGRLVSVIDCEANQDGDRRFDLVTLAYWLGFVGAAEGVSERLTALTTVALPVELLAAYRAHMVLRNVDFYARTSRPDHADAHVVYGERLLDEVGA